MDTKKSTAKTIFWLYLPIFLAVFCLACWYLYYYLYLSGTIKIATSYVSEATYADDKTYFLELELFGNENGNGIESLGVKVNCYTDVEMPEKDENGKYDTKNMYSYGMQTLGTPKFYDTFDVKSFTKRLNYTKWENVVYYNSHKGESFVPVDSLKDKNHWVWDISGQLYLIEERGEVYTNNRVWIKCFDDMNFDKFLVDLYHSAQSCEEGISVLLFDMSKFLKTRPYDETSGGFVEYSDQYEQWTFVEVKITRHRDGLVSASQSMFNRYNGDPTWNLENRGDVNYWTAKTVRTLTNDDFTIVNQNGQTLLKVKSTCNDYLSAFRDLLINVNLDLAKLEEKFKVKIDGMAKDAFYTLPVNEVDILSDENKDFYNYAGVKINSANLNIIEGGAA